MDRYFKNGHCFSLTGMDGIYEIKEIIGKGVSCIVYRATFTDKDGIQTEHLLKEYNPSLLNVSRDENGCLSVPEEALPAFLEGMGRFQAGYRLQLNMRQKIREVTNSTSNIQQIHADFGTQYVDMTLFEGETYRNVQEQSLYDLMRRMKAITQVIRDYHKAGFLHLDIKPDNIFTIPETCELVMLFDFDSVTEKSQIADRQALPYTKGWAPPEQINFTQGKNIYEASDLYAIGEIVFWQIFGRHSADEEHWSFYDYEFHIDAPIFKNVNPKVFPCLAELFHKTICVSVKERYQTADKLIEKLDKLIKLADPKEPYLVSKSVTPKAFFIGRGHELAKMHKELQNSPKLFLSGIGGIGKSELAKNYAIHYKESYDVVLFASFNGNLMMLINDDSKIQITNFGRYDGEKEQDYCIRKLKKLSELCDARTLFIIDNLSKDEFFDEEQKIWESILSLNCKLIFTTIISDWGYPCLKAGILQQHQSLVDLYGHYCKVQDGQRPAVDAIIDYVNGHTLTVELIAKLVAVSRFSPETVLENLKKYGISISKSGKQKIVLDKDNARRRKTPSEHIRAIFDMAGLSDMQLYIMANMALVPLDGIETVLLKEWCMLKDLDAVNRLASAGWIDLVENKIKMHPVIAEAALDSCTRPNPDSCRTMLQNQAKYLERYTLKDYPDYGRTYQDVIFFHALAENLIRSKIKTESVADIMTSIPGLIYEFGYMGQAARYQQYALAICRQRYGKQSVEAVKAMNNLSLLYKGLGDFDRAFQYSKLALHAKRKPLWFFNFEMAVSVAASYNIQASIYYCKGQYPQALQCAHMALAMQERLLGEEDIETIVTMNNLGAIYHEAGKFKEAFHYQKRALSLKQKLYGKDHISAAESLGNLSTQYYDMGDFAQALRYAKKALKIEKQHWGDNHAATAATYSNLSAHYYKLKDYGRAVQCAKKSLEIKAELLGKDNVSLCTPLCNLGALYGKLGDYGQALKYMQQALRIETAAFGEMHPKIIISYNNIAGIYDDMGNFAQALRIYKQALHMAQTLFGPRHRLVTVCLSNIGCLYEKANERKKAEKYYAWSYKICLEIFGNSHPSTKRAKKRWLDVKNGQ